MPSFMIVVSGFVPHSYLYLFIYLYVAFLYNKIFHLRGDITDGNEGSTWAIVSQLHSLSQFGPSQSVVLGYSSL